MTSRLHVLLWWDKIDISINIANFARGKGENGKILARRRFIILNHWYLSSANIIPLVKVYPLAIIMLCEAQKCSCCVTD